MTWQLIALGMALALNNTLASVALGAGYMPRWHQLRTALLFAFFEALMPLLGVLTGQEAALLIGSKARFIGIGVLAVVGIYSLVKVEKKDEPQPSDEPATRKLAARPRTQTLVLAFALSIDNLTVGFGLGMLHVPLLLATVTFGVVSLVMTLIGLEIGRYLGSKFTLSADKLSGVVLLLTAGVMILQ